MNLNRRAFGARPKVKNVHYSSSSLQASSTIYSHYPIYNSIARFRMLFANIHHYACRSKLLGIITCRRKRSASSILCAARFREGVLRPAVFRFVLVQDGYRAFCQAASYGPRSLLSVVATSEIGSKISPLIPYNLQALPRILC
jgi:hypothetical protein